MSPRVIVIGNDEVSSKELVSLLEDVGIEASVGSDEGSLESSGKDLPNIVIVEERAGAGGWEVSTRIRECSDIPIIMLGESDSEISWVKAAACGVDCYLPKPFGSGELAARIRTLVRRYDGTLRGFMQIRAKNWKQTA